MLCLSHYLSLSFSLILSPFLCVLISLITEATHQCDQIGRFIGLWATF